MTKSIMKKTFASDYIAIKRKSAIFSGKNNTLKIKKDDDCSKITTSNSFELLNNFYNGQNYCKAHLVL